MGPDLPGDPVGIADPDHRRRLLVPLIVASLLVTVGALSLVAAPPGRVLANTRVAGVTIGRLEPAAALAAVRDALERDPGLRPPAELVVTTPDGVVRVPTDALGVRPDPEATLAAALSLGRAGAPGDLLVRLRALRTATEVPAVVRVDEAAVRAAVDALADRIERAPHAGDVRVDRRTLGVSVAPPQRGVRVRREEAVAALTAALAQRSRGAVALPAEVLPAPAGPDAAEALAELLRRALAADLLLVADGRSVTVAPADLAAAVTVRTGRDAAGRPVPELHLDRRVVADTLGPRITATFAREAEDARLAVPDPERFTAMGSAVARPVPVELVLDPGRTRRRFDAVRTARQLEALVASGRRVATVDLRETPAPRSPEDLARHPLPTHLLGTFTTFHPAGADRTVNIRRLADAVDGTLVPPGGELSVNGISGERRCEDGYLPAGTIVRGELVDTCGGGVSQFGTTTYNAAFFAGLPTPQWQPHSFYIGRYPMGREATLSFPDLDVRAVNDTDGWLLVRTSHTPTSVTVALYGRPRWAEVRAVHGEPRDPRPFPTELRPAPDLRPGAERVLQAGTDGFTIDVTRVLVPIDGGAPLTERRTTVYLPQTRIVEVGVPPADAGTVLPD